MPNKADIKLNIAVGTVGAEPQGSPHNDWAQGKELENGTWTKLSIYWFYYEGTNVPPGGTPGGVAGGKVKLDAKNDTFTVEAKSTEELHILDIEIADPTTYYTITGPVGNKTKYTIETDKASVAAEDKYCVYAKFKKNTPAKTYPIIRCDPMVKNRW